MNNIKKLNIQQNYAEPHTIIDTEGLIVWQGTTIDNIVEKITMQYLDPIEAWALLRSNMVITIVKELDGLKEWTNTNIWGITK